MASHRLKRTLRRSLAVSAVLAAVLSPTPVSAQPATPPGTTSDAMKEYNDLAGQAAQADEDLLDAEEDLKVKQGELDKAKNDLAAASSSEDQAKAAMAQFEGQVSEFTSASFRGARLSGISALLVSDSQQNFLDRMSALNVLAVDNSNALQQLRSAVDKADNARTTAADAQRRAQEATDAAEKLTSDIKQRKSELDARIKQVKQALNKLSPTEKKTLGTLVKDNGVYLGPPGAANTALQAALAKRGSEYEWAGVGPKEFDCSGLTMWAYNAAGIKLPHSSRSQYTLGRGVSANELLPGDLLFYDDGTGNPSRIHHVSMYVGDGKMVDAPTEGQLVDIRPIRGDGHFIGARRIVG